MDESFETYRTYLLTLACSMLGSAREAEEMVQETYHRFLAAPNEAVGSLQASLTALLTRACLERLQLVSHQREPDGDPWPLESVRTTEMAETNEPGQPIGVWASIVLASLLVLEQLPPFEQAVFLLHTVFAHEFAVIALLLGMQEAACRRSFHQARAYLRKHRPRFPMG